MTTAFSDIAAAVVAKLLEVPAITGGRVYRGQAWPMPEGTNSMAWVRVLTAGSERTGITGGPIDWTTSLEVEMRVRYEPDTEAPDEAIDPELEAAFAKLATFTLAGVEDVVPGVAIDWDYSEADVNVVGVTVRMDVVHRTASSTLTAW